jgi:membrane fusion protein (multidrug efflux system)
MAAGTLKVPELGKVGVTLLLEDGSTYPHPGHLDFLDLAIDQATGTAAVRAEFPNPERILLPGQFVRARIEAGVRPHGFWIPQRAVLLNPSGATVLTVAQGDTIAPRPVKLGEQRGDKWIVLEGLKDGDRIVVDGIQKVQPGVHVRVIDADQPAAADAAKPAER